MLTDLHRQFANTVIEALGGTMEVAKLFGYTEQRVCNWRKRGLPPDTYDALRPLVLKKVGSAPPLMWRQVMLQRKKVPRYVRKNGRK